MLRQSKKPYLMGWCSVFPYRRLGSSSFSAPARASVATVAERRRTEERIRNQNQQVSMPASAGAAASSSLDHSLQRYRAHPRCGVRFFLYFVFSTRMTGFGVRSSMCRVGGRWIVSRCLQSPLFFWYNWMKLHPVADSRGANLAIFCRRRQYRARNSRTPRRPSLGMNDENSGGEYQVLHAFDKRERAVQGTDALAG